MAKITYTNKVALNENPEIADINKVKDDDMNEIKSVVNTNDDNVGDLTTLTTTTKTSIVAAINEVNSAVGLTVHDSYSQSTTEPYSANYVNGLIDTIYPVGSIYMSINNTNPSTLFGGTWEQIQDTFLLSAGSTYTAGDTGGSANHLHKTGIGHAANYLVFDTKNHSETTSSLGFSTVPSASGVSTTSVVDLYSEMQTNSVSNLPPYLVVYMWKRTA